MSVFSCARRGDLEKVEEETARKCSNANNAVSLVRSSISNLYTAISAPVHPSLLNRLVSVNRVIRYLLSDDSKYPIVLCMLRCFQIFGYIFWTYAC